MDNGSPTDGRALRTRPSATGPNRSDGMKSVVELRLWALSGTGLTAHETTGAPRPGREDMTKEECLCAGPRGNRRSHVDAQGCCEARR